MKNRLEKRRKCLIYIERISAKTTKSVAKCRTREALEQAEILSEVKPEVAIVDRGYRGAEIDGVTIWRSGQKRGVTRTIKAMIKRRSAIEPTIGHMKTEGKLDRNWLKGTLGDAVHAVLCGAGHNLRMLVNKVKLATHGQVAY